MTTQTTLQFNVSKHGWTDAFVVSVLALVLGAFVAQISTVTERQLHSSPVATAPASTPSHG